MVIPINTTNLQWDKCLMYRAIPTNTTNPKWDRCLIIKDILDKWDRCLIISNIPGQWDSLRGKCPITRDTLAKWVHKWECPKAIITCRRVITTIPSSQVSLIFLSIWQILTHKISHLDSDQLCPRIKSRILGRAYLKFIQLRPKGLCSTTSCFLT